MKRLIVSLLIVGALSLNAQTGIGTATPNPSAKLDVYATNKGFLPPRVALTSVTDATTISSPAEGLLVYNTGSVGLQAGYYYWNGANWATIATATSAGNGVTASDMVKLYDGVGNAATINSTGVNFSVTTSGKYLFDFSTSATCANCSATINFQVRDGSNSNAVIGSDMQTSYNNNVHSEYNGKVEVNLIAGRSYNVLVTASSGSIYNNDYCRVYMKQVSGNLPVTGQSVDYTSVTRTTSQTVNTGDKVLFNQINGGNIPYNSATGNFTLTAGKTYRMTGYISLANNNATAEEVNVAWKTAAGDLLSNKGELLSTNFGTTAAAVGVADVIYTPTSNTTVSLSVVYTSSGVILWGNFTYAIIEQIGSSAIINPWVLSGNDVYNTTGKVGIGTNAPTQALDVTGNANVSGKITLADPSGNVTVKAAAFVNAGVPVTLGDIQVQMITSGQRSLQIKTTGASFTGMVSAYTTYNGASGTQSFTYFSDVSQTVNGTFAYIGSSWGFSQEGDVANYFVRDLSNQRFWRITLMVGGSFNNNVIIIERLL